MIIESKTAFGRALAFELDHGPWGLGKELAEAVSAKVGTYVDPAIISQMKLGKRPGKALVREAIAAYFGYTYEEFVERGKQLIKQGVVRDSDDEHAALKAVQDRVRAIFDSSDIEGFSMVATTVNFVFARLASEPEEDED